jgi:hypothetical protein
MSPGPPTRVEIPIRIRVDPSALAERPEELEDALATAVGRALDSSRRVLLADAGPAGDVRVGRPQVRWTGGGLGDVDEPTRAATVARVDKVVADATDDLRRQAKATPPDPDPGRDPFAPPSPQQRRQWARQPEPPLQPIVDVDGFERDLRSSDTKVAGLAILSIWRHITEGDATAFRLALVAIRPDNAYPTEAAVNALAELAKRDPRRFRSLLRTHLGTVTSAGITRGDTDLFVEGSLLKDPAVTLRGAALRVARKLAAGAPVSAELEAALPGLGAVAGLRQALGERYVELLNALSASAERTDASVVKAITDRATNLDRFLGILAGLRDDPRLRALLPDLEADLIGNHRWVSEVLERVRTIDASLALYRELFGAAADTQEEVELLGEIRGLLLDQIARNPLPTRGVLGGLREQAAEAYADWQGRALDRRLERLRQGLLGLRERNKALHEVDPYYDRGPIDFDQPDLRTPLHGRIRETRQALAELERDLSGLDRRDFGELLRLERSLGLTGLRLTLLLLWMGTLELQSSFMFPRDLGSKNEQQRWRGTFVTMRTELAGAYANPDFGTIQSQLESWASTLKATEANMRSVAKREFWTGLIIDIAALLVAAGVSRWLSGGLSFAEVAVVEAGTFTVLSGLGRSWLLDRGIDPSQMFNQFLDTMILFGAFKLLDRLVAAGVTAGVRVAIGEHVLAEFAAVLGATTVVNIGLSVVIARVQSGEWPSSFWTIAGAGLLMSAVGAVLATPALLRALEAEAAALAAAAAALEREEALALIKELPALAAAGRRWDAAFRQVMRRGHLSQAEWEQLRRQGLDTARRLQDVLGRLGRMTDETLARLNLERGQLRAASATMGGVAERMEGLVYTGPAVPRLPGPAELVPAGVRPTTAGGFEYDPAVVSAGSITRRFRARGYEVTDLGGGVLRLTAAGGAGPSWHLLPAGPVLAALPPGRSLSDAELAVQAAIQPATRELARPSVTAAQWRSVVEAAELDAELVRRAIQAGTGELAPRLQELTELLRTAGVDAATVGRVGEAVTSLNGLRLATQGETPPSAVLAMAGPGATAEVSRILDTPDGQALAIAAAREPDLVAAAVIAPESALSIELIKLGDRLRGAGLPEPQIRAAQRGIAAVRRARQAAAVGPDELLVTAAGGQVDAQGVVHSLTYDAEGKAVLDLVARAPELARKAVNASSQTVLKETLDTLTKQATQAGATPAQVAALRRTLTDLNQIARTAGERFERQRRLGELKGQLYDQDALTKAATDVLERYSGFRKREGRQWLQQRDWAAEETYELNRAVQSSPPAVTGLSVETLRDMWIRFRAPRQPSRQIKSKSFADYVGVLQRHGRGRIGELTFAFWVGRAYHLLKVPKGLVTEPGTDLWLVPRRPGADILLVDVKELAGAEIAKADAVTRNLPQNLTQDLKSWDELVKRADPDLPAQVTDAINRINAAQAEIDKIVNPPGRKPLTKAQVNTVRVQRRITAALARHGIRRVVGPASEEAAKQVGAELQKRGVEDLQVIQDELDLMDKALQEVPSLETEIEGKD